MIKASLSSGKVTLFRQDSGVAYRIPALLFSPPDTFLAFAEERSSLKDEHAKHLVLRRGRKEGDSVEWGPMQSLMSAVLPGHRTMNPCPVYEWETQTVFLFFICVEKMVSEQEQIRKRKNAARLCYVHSTDVGQTWSSLTDLTDQVIGEDVKNWATFAVGPGHGVQLNSGRLVIPAYVYHITTSHEIQGCAFMFYSDDKGKNWQKGELIRDVETEKPVLGGGEKMKLLECQVAEVVCQSGDTVLYCNARTETKSQCRAEAFSTDQGLKFMSPSLCKHLYESPPQGCQGSVVSFTPTVGNSQDAPSSLVYSHPTRKRIDLGIYHKEQAHLLEEAKWEDPWILYKGPSGYSDLAVCQGPPLLFGCLFECGKTKENEEIAFQLFTEKELPRSSGCS